MLIFYCNACDVKLIWCTVLTVLGSLAALVYQHSQTPLSLPCKLIIPDSSEFTQAFTKILLSVSSVRLLGRILCGFYALQIVLLRAQCRHCTQVNCLMNLFYSYLPIWFHS